MSKEQFIKDFSDFLKEKVPYFEDLKGLVYNKDDRGEWLYCNYRSYSQKKIDITADSEVSIMTDFFKYIDSSPWIVPINEEIYEKAN